jgi:hypothetical protein
VLSASCTTQQQTAVNAPAGTPPTAAPTPGAFDLAKTAQMIKDPDASHQAAVTDRGKYAWDLFVLLNSPVTGTNPKSWETTYRSSDTVYLSNGCPPPSWGQTPPPPATVQQQAQSLPGYVPGSVIHFLGGVNKFQVNGLVLKDKWNQPLLYQILMNEDTFNYIISRSFYNVEGQEQAAKNNDPAKFPATSFELKTSWIWLSNDQTKYNELKGTYYIVPAYYENVVNGKSLGYVVGNAALAGMHIINKQQPDWIWITFENVKNPNYTQAKLELPIPDYAVQANKTYQQQLQSQGSVFANYQLDGVQMAFNDPTLLANSTIESAFQKESSCMTCHALSSIKANGAYFNLVNNQGGNVAYYTGNPPDLSGWTSLDFVWSLKRASRKNNNVCTSSSPQ